MIGAESVNGDTSAAAGGAEPHRVAARPTKQIDQPGIPVHQDELPPRLVGALADMPPPGGTGAEDHHPLGHPESLRR